MASNSSELLQHVIAFIERRSQRPLQATSEVMAKAPPLSSVMQLRWSPPQLEPADITKHNSDLAALNPKEWATHLLGLNRDIYPAYEKALDFDPAVYYFVRPDPDDIPGEKMFDGYRDSTFELATFETFQRRFDIITRGALAGLAFNNAVVAGGIVLACLLHEGGDWERYQDSDVDIFLCGETVQQATEQAHAVEAVLRANVSDFGSNYSVMRTVNTITFTPRPAAVANGYRSIQLVTTLYSNVGEILSLFDLGPVSVAYDGEDVWFSPRALWSICTAYTHITDAIRGSSASRILKYAQRGFGLCLVESDNSNNVRETVRKQTDQVLAVVAGTKVQFGVAHLQPTMFGYLLHWVKAGQVACTAAERSTDYIASTGEANNNAEAFVAIGLLSQGKLDRGDAGTLGIAGGPTRHHSSLHEAISAGMRMNVLLPLGFRDVANQVSPGSVKKIKKTGTCVDDAGTKFELCTWNVPSSTSWVSPSQGHAAGLDRFMKKAAALTNWAIEKTDLGAPWIRLTYGKTMLSIMENDVDAAIIDADHFRKWLES
ncbi:hypothetical protein CF326_g1704 [Tilletia indica]|nr:hypothetical protein CF326_g1704 [Tilletia indica]